MTILMSFMKGDAERSFTGSPSQLWGELAKEVTS